MAIRDTWRRSLEYFGLVEGDYIEEGEYLDDEPETGSEYAVEEPSRQPMRAPARETASMRSRGGRRGDDIDDIFADDAPPRRRTQVAEPVESGPIGNGGSIGQVHLVTPRNFNDAKQIADEFKNSKPVIINLQDSDRELSKRLIDFASGMTYALGGGMQKIAEKVFLLSPENVEVSAEEKARILEGGFFNQS